MSKLLLLMVACGVAMFGCSNDSEPKEVQQVEETEEIEEVEEEVEITEDDFIHSTWDLVEKERSETTLTIHYNGTKEDFMARLQEGVDLGFITDSGANVLLQMGVLGTTDCGGYAKDRLVILDKDGQVMFDGDTITISVELKNIIF